MKPVKRNNFLNFLCAFIPGASEMYMGFMKKGLSMLALFAAAVAIPAGMYAGDIFFIIPVVVYIYSFFHARYFAKATDEDFEKIEDNMIWEEFTGVKKIDLSGTALRKWVAVVLIVFGAASIWGMLLYVFMEFELWNRIMTSDEFYALCRFVNRVPQLIIAILAIVIGAKLIKGKKKEVEDDGRESDN